MDNGFIEDGFIVNLSNASNAAEVIYELSSILEMPEAQKKKICLKLEGIDLTQSQLLSIKALIESMESTLEFVDTTSDATKEAANALEIQISELKNEMEIPQIQPTEEELQQLTSKPDLFSSSVHDFAFQELAQEEGLMKPEEMKPYATMDEDEVPNLELEGDEEDLEKLPTLYLNQTLRSGQTVTSDGNIVVIGDANPGSEIIARGDVTVWGVLGGIAHAGSKGNAKACIRALKMNAIQLRIANFYARRVNTENIPFVQKTSSFTPEEARVDGKSIVIKTTYESKEK
ncbi:septum site-determining protein MinC [bacterium]|nr:septum site-determining protein MinC [bacterium]